eukprot:scaffold1402_cov254-Pinguiococcus_pyrenoidosus.AAC.43
MEGLEANGKASASKQKRRGEAEEEKEEETEKEEEEMSVIAMTAFVAAGSAVVLRLGGRAALLNAFGLDMLRDEGFKANIDQFLSTADELGIWTWFFFLASWTISKTLCLDFVAVILAISSGILFGGVIKGTLASCTCAAIGSMVPFLISRTTLAENVRGRMDEAPGLRAVEDAVADEGYRAVFTLRLAPLLPIPIGAYAYIYGLTRLELPDFVLGTFLGSIKPYLLDSYLGVFGKSVLDAPEDASGMTDFLLVGTIAAAVAVGTFASRLATATLSSLQTQMDLYKDSPSTMELTYVGPAWKDDGAAPQKQGRAIEDGVISGLAFWGILAQDLPRWMGTILSLCDEAQGRLRPLFEQEWSKVADERAAKLAEKAKESSKSEAEAPGGLSGRFGAKAPGSGDGAVKGLRIGGVTKPGRIGRVVQGSVAGDAQEEHRAGLQLAQSFMFLPVAVESVAKYSDPALFPDILQEVREEAREALEARDRRRGDRASNEEG